ncbi:cysteine protease StiP domain-containing protein [Paracoccus sp. ME4]|uniref:cysteine protease StiP domain-containing protein n=1 Tax=Paracoccus sp. ME4 TaxID=3138066 RepID=UPI00398B1013
MKDIPHDHTSFSGSYAQGDIDFLLKEVQIQATGIDEKESAIQSGARHYSEMISDEARPDELYMLIFGQAWAAGADRIAREVNAIADAIVERIAAGKLCEQVTLCSLVRAGAPLGVLLNRALKDRHVDVAHFGISIIRDKGLDANAMRHVMERRPAEGILFIDGWTGKGAIAKELHRSWMPMSGLDPFLIVLADPCGMADLAGSHEDWLIPSGILGANVSGLISRSILNADVIGPDDFHGYIPVTHLADIDCSAAFVDKIHDRMKTCEKVKPVGHVIEPGASLRLRRQSFETVQSLMELFETTNSNRIKPGIAEATRAVLRRKPHHVLLSSRDDEDLAALIHLCVGQGVEWSVRPDLTGPYRAITIIEKVS